MALLAIRDLEPGTVVAQFEGRFVTFAEIPEAEMRHALWFDAERWLIPSSPSRYFNHGCAPNCALRDRPGDAQSCDVVTVKRVRAGDELTIAYDLIDAETWFAHEGEPEYAFWHPSWSFDCLCGAPACRGRIDRYVLTGDVAGARRRATGDK